MNIDIHIIQRENGYEVLIQEIGGKVYDNIFKTEDDAKEYVIRYISGGE